MTGIDDRMPGSAGPQGSRGRLFWLSALAGWAIVGFGLRGILHHHLDTRPSNLAAFVVGGALVHDLIVAPVLLVLGVLISRNVPARARATVQAALFVSACLALYSYPLVRGYARIQHNPSSLPHDYAVNLALVLGSVWILALGTAIVGARRRTRHR